MTESLRDAIAEALDEMGECEVPGPCDCDPFCRFDMARAEVAEAVARKWFADWLRSDEAAAVMDAVECENGGLGCLECAVPALADALTKENPC